MTGQVTFLQMQRLLPSLQEHQGRFQVELNFDFDADQKVCVDLKLNGDLVLLCQRCLEKMPYSMALQVQLSPCHDEETASEIPDYYEPLLLQEGSFNVVDMLEQEVLLALPLVPTHADENCLPEVYRAVLSEIEEDSVLEAPTYLPFENLKKN